MDEHDKNLLKFFACASAIVVAAMLALVAGVAAVMWAFAG